MIPEKNRPYILYFFIKEENWITKKMMLEKIQGRYKPKFKSKKKDTFNFPPNIKMKRR